MLEGTVENNAQNDFEGEVAVDRLVRDGRESANAELTTMQRVDYEFSNFRTNLSNLTIIGIYVVAIGRLI